MTGEGENRDTKGKGRAAKVRLGDREFIVLAALEKWGILGLGQLEAVAFRPALMPKSKVDLFFNEFGREAYDGYAYKRLRRLEMSGYIGRFQDHDHWWGWALRPRGKAALEACGKSRTPAFRRSWSGRAVGDFIRCNAVGLAVKEIVGRAVTSRFQLACDLRSRGRKARDLERILPDALATGDPPLAVTAYIRSLLLEGKKWREGYGAFWTRLYLCNEGERRSILHMARDRRLPHIHVGDFWEFREKLGETRMTNSRGEISDLGRLLEARTAAAGKTALNAARD